MVEFEASGEAEQRGERYHAAWVISTRPPYPAIRLFGFNRRN